MDWLDNQHRQQQQPQRGGFFGAIGRAFSDFATGIDRMFQGFGRAISSWWNKLTENERENALYYDARGGNLYHHVNGQRITVASGLLSGNGDGLNNPARQYERNRGVTPEGGYSLSFGTHSNPAIGKYVRMNPIENEQMRGRDGILMHYGKLASGQRGSLGCITFQTTQQRDQVFNYIRQNNINRMWVYDPGNENRMRAFYGMRPEHTAHERAGPLQNMHRPAPPAPRPAAHSYTAPRYAAPAAHGHYYDRSQNYGQMHRPAPHYYGDYSHYYGGQQHPAQHSYHYSAAHRYAAAPMPAAMPAPHSMMPPSASHYFYQATAPAPSGYRMPV